MAQSNASSAIAATADKALDLGLRDAGFRRQGAHLVRRLNGIIHGIKFRAARGTASPLGTFTLSVVVTSETLYRAWAGTALPRNPATALFPLCQGIVQLAPGAPVMWDVRDAQEINRISDDVANLIMAKVLPFLDQYRSPMHFLERIREAAVPRAYPPCWWDLVRAILAKTEGFDDEARQALRRAHDNAVPVGFRQTVLQMAKRLGVTAISEQPGNDKNSASAS
jgi:hypothetical protein